MNYSFERDKNLFIKFLEDQNAQFNATIIEDYCGFNISIFKVFNNEDYYNGIWVYIDDMFCAKHDNSVSIKMAEVYAKEFVEDVIVPEIEARTL